MILIAQRNKERNYRRGQFVGNLLNSLIASFIFLLVMQFILMCIMCHRQIRNYRFIFKKFYGGRREREGEIAKDEKKRKA